MTSTRAKRLMKERGMLETSSMVDSLEELEMGENLTVWKVKLACGLVPDYFGTVEVIFKFCRNFPFSPPTVMIHDLYHPNIYPNGALCMSLLDNDTLPGGVKKQAQWRASLCMATLLIGVLSVLQDPNPDSPANPSAARVYNREKDKYEEENRKRMIWIESWKLMVEQEEEYAVSLKLDQTKEQSVVERAEELDVNEGEQQQFMSKEKERTVNKLKESSVPKNEAPSAHKAASAWGAEYKTVDQARLKTEEDQVEVHSQVATIRFRTPTGMFVHEFGALGPLSNIFLFLEAAGFERGRFRVTTWPKRDLTNLPGETTLAELKLVPKETLTVETIEMDE